MSDNLSAIRRALPVALVAILLIGIGERTGHRDRRRTRADTSVPIWP